MRLVHINFQFLDVQHGGQSDLCIIFRMDTGQMLDIILVLMNKNNRPLHLTTTIVERGSFSEWFLGCHRSLDFDLQAVCTLTP